MVVVMRWAQIAIVSGLLTFAAHSAQAAAPPPAMELEIRANGQIVLSGQILDGMDELEARLRVLRAGEPPLELRLRLPKYFSFDTIAAIAQIVQRLGMSLVPIFGGREAPKPAAIDLEPSTI
jgi:hypothetical protein